MNWYQISCFSYYFFLSFWRKESIIAIVSKRTDIRDLTSRKVYSKQSISSAEEYPNGME